MEKCTFCVQRIRRTTREARRDGLEVEDGNRELNPACVNSCPTDALLFGDLNDADSKVAKKREHEMGEHGRGYRLFEDLGTDPNVLYLKKVDKDAKEVAHA